MKTMAIDLGEKRIGIALSDPSGIIALPLTTITGIPRNERMNEILRLLEENQAEEIVVGLPLSLSGKLGPSARSVTQFVELLTNQCSVPVITVDERYSTAEAERLISHTGVKPSKNRPKIDSTAATIILQAYLDSKRNR